jgi:hypothetical protein
MTSFVNHQNGWYMPMVWYSYGTGVGNWGVQNGVPYGWFPVCHAYYLSNGNSAQWQASQSQYWWTMLPNMQASLASIQVKDSANNTITCITNQATTGPWPVFQSSPTTGTRTSTCDITMTQGMHTGMNVLMGDGSVHLVSQSVSTTSWNASITPNGGDTLGNDF